MNSTHIEKKIAEMTRRSNEIATEQLTADADLRQKQQSYAAGKCDVAEVTQAQSTCLGISGALVTIADNLVSLRTELAQAVESETKAAQIAELTSLVEASNSTLKQYDQAQRNAVQMIEFAAKSLYDTLKRHDRTHIAANNFLNADDTVVGLGDLDMETVGTTKKHQYFGAPASGVTPEGEDLVYLRSLNQILTHFATVGESLRPCPEVPELMPKEV